MRRTTTFLTGLLALPLLAGCRGGGDAGEGLSGMIQTDGSSTVFPVTQAMAEEFQIANSGVRVTVGVSGTGGGFEKFCNGETAISNASRPIRDSERERCAANGIEPIELTVAWDGLTVVVNPENDWATCMTVDELRRVWQPGSTIRRWSEIRDGWPDQPIELYGPDTDSGTFDYFTESIVGEAEASRADYTASADDNVLVLGVSGDGGALGYFGYAYYEQNEDKLKALEIDGGNGCVAPTRVTVEDQSYTPLSRPLFIYVRPDALERPEVRAFLEFYIENGEALVPETGYVPLNAADYDAQLAKLPATSGGS